MSGEKKKGLIGKILEATDMSLEKYISDSRADMTRKAQDGALMDDADGFYRRSYYAPLHDAYYQAAVYKEKPTRIDFSILKLMSYRDTIIASIIQTRINQLCLFSRPQKNKYTEGFIIRRKKERDQSLQDDENKIKELEQQDKAIIDQLTEFISNCGHMNDRPQTELLSFEAFLRRAARDRLTYDQVAVEKINDNADKLHHFIPVDSGTIRFASKVGQDVATASDANSQSHNNLVRQDTEEERKEAEENENMYAQVIDARVVRGFTSEDLIFRMGNPVNDIYANGYSVGELELLVSTITSHLQAETYNKLFFTQGHVTKGILHFQADVPQRKLKALRQQWDAQTSGNVNSWRTPIFAGSDKISWIPLTQSNRDIEYSNWMNYLIKIACAIYCISPEEIGFDIAKEAGSPGGVFQSQNETRIKHSKDKGLRPLLRFFEDFINEEIIDKINNEFCLEFVGLDAESRVQEVERENKEVRYSKTIDEIRAEDGMEPLGPEKGGHLILDPQYVQWISQFGEFESERKQESMMGGGEFEPGEEEGFEVPSEGEEQGEEVERSLKKSKSPKLIKIEWYKK